MNRTEDATAVRALLSSLVDTWNNGDGAAYGALFTEDATYVTYIGTLYRGGQEIGSTHQALFDSFLKGTRLADEIVDIRFPSADVALVVTHGCTYKGKPGKLDKIQTYTVVRQDDGRWLIAAWQNTKRKPVMEAVSFRFQPDSKPAAQR